MSLTLTAALIGFALASGIFFLVRRDHLHGTQAIFWLLIALTALVLGSFPGLVDSLGRLLAVKYPPMALVVLVIAALLIKQLIADIELARKERRIRRLTQKLAILEYELRQSMPQGHAGNNVTALPAHITGERRVVR